MNSVDRRLGLSRMNTYTKPGRVWGLLSEKGGDGAAWLQGEHGSTARHGCAGAVRVQPRRAWPSSAVGGNSQSLLVAPSSYASTGRSTRREKSNYTTVRYRLRCKGNPQEKSRWYSTAFAVRGTPRKNLNSSDNLRFPVTAHCNLHSVGVSDLEASSMTVLVASAAH